MLTEPEHRIKIIITDDHRLFRSGVRTSLTKKNDIDIIGEAEHGLDLLNKLIYLQPDIIILGISMPVMNGVETLPILKKRYPGIKVIILTMHNDPAMICRMIELGANAYLTKESGSEKIYEAILACHKNWFFINDTVRYALTGTTPEYTGGYSDKEIQLLKSLQGGKTINNIGDEVDLSPRTVSAIIDRLKTRTGSKSIEALIEFAVENKIID